MNGVADLLFGPLGPEYCDYFYYLSIFSYLSLCMFVFSAVYIGMNTKTKPGYYLQVISIALLYFIFYLEKRIFYGMCVR